MSEDLMLFILILVTIICTALVIIACRFFDYKEAKEEYNLKKNKKEEK